MGSCYRCHGQTTSSAGNSKVIRIKQTNTHGMLAGWARNMRTAQKRLVLFFIFYVPLECWGTLRCANEFRLYILCRRPACSPCFPGRPPSRCQAFLMTKRRHPEKEGICNVWIKHRNQNSMLKMLKAKLACQAKLLPKEFPKRVPQKKETTLV